MKSQATIKSWHLLAVSLVIISILSISSIPISAFSPPAPNHTGNLVVGGTFAPGPLGTEMDITIDGGQTLPGWCVNESVDIYVNTQYPADLYNYLYYYGNSYPANVGQLPSAIITNTYTQTSINWPAVAYILNHKVSGCGFMDIQKAFWYFSDNDSSNLSDNTQTMVNTANSYLNAHNGVYIPGPGQLEPIICYVPGSTPLQVIFYEYTVPPMPDLVITSVSAVANPTDPTWYSLTITVKNQGNADAAANTISVEVDNAGVISEPVCPPLAAGGSCTVTVPSGELQQLSGTSDTIKVTADELDTILESDKTNNSFSTTYSALTISANSGPNGSISPSGNVMVSQGANQSFSVTPNAHYRVAGVQVDGTSAGSVSNYTFNNVTANHTISASFAVNTCTVTFVLGTNGILGSGNLVQTVNYGADATAPVVNANSGWIFTGWDTAFTNVPSDLTVNAVYTRSATFTIISSAGNNGSITPLGSNSVNYGAGQSFTITPNAGYHVSNVLVDGSSQGTPYIYTFNNVTGNHTIAASFSKNASVPFWDINIDHVCNYLDVGLLGIYYGETGSPGWVREDINSDGVINYLDLGTIGNYYGQAWSLTDYVNYYTINDGSDPFSRSSTPMHISAGSAVLSHSTTADGSIALNISNAPGYSDVGFYLYAGQLKNLNNIQVQGDSSSNPFGLNLWFDKDGNPDYFNWNNNSLTNLGNDAYILGPSSQNGILSVDVNSQFTSLNPGGGNYTLAQLKSGAAAGINGDTPVAIWIGITTNSGGNLDNVVSGVSIH